MTASQHKNTSFIARLSLAFTVLFSTVSCSSPKGTLFYGVLGKGSAAVILASSKTSSNAGTNAVVAYGTDGLFQQQLADLTTPNQKPKGIAQLDAFNLIVGLDGAVKILAKTSLLGGYSTFASGSTFTAPVGEVARYTGSGGTATFNIQGNTIDAFNDGGGRIGATASPVIATTTGSCVLNSPKGLFVDNDNNRLFVTNSGSAGLLVYDISDPAAPTCQSTNSTLGAISPTGVIKHSNGFLYIVSAVSPAVSVKLFALAGDGSGSATAVYTDISGTVLNLSTAIAELPDGSVLIANNGTGQVDRFQVNGLSAATLVGTFVKDAFTTYITKIFVVGGM